MIEITPIEFEQENYKDKVSNRECIVWYKNEHSVEWVERKGNRQNYYQLHSDFDGWADNTLVANVRSYEVCLTVEDITDKMELRKRIFRLFTDILDRCENDDLIRLKIDLQQEWLL